MKKNKGISLIVLVITIIVIIILAGAVILSLANNNPIESANEAKFKTNVAEYNAELAMAISNEYLKDNSFDSATFEAGVWDGIGDETGTIKEYITSMTAVDGVNFEIKSGKLVYTNTEEQIQQMWALETGILVKYPQSNAAGTELDPGIPAIINTTTNGYTPMYSNPIIPAGFMPVNTTNVSWDNLLIDYNNGLVIQDVSGNQFVWVPVDETNVSYAKNFTYPSHYGATLLNTIDDTFLSGVINENTQISKYGGFYIARYESMFDYNGGNMRAASKKSIDKEDTTSWSGARDNSHTGYLWNYINYADAKTYSENMAASYEYDTSKILTNLITGTEWDVTMEWINNSGNSVTDSTTWGNHLNSVTPADVTGFGNLQISGFNENWKSNNIYDLAGNTWEWTNELHSSYSVIRSGGYDYDGISDSAAYRIGYTATNFYDDLTFRIALYIL
ncbi:MAG: hypothetical protein PHD15_04240 [Clostridia bacterium]|nr:hypothetical protein [Clostridia bacterium]MDD4386950.1 hypothetical protein [Clostridia bacterium]